jgi:hypothetical protein
MENWLREDSFGIGPMRLADAQTGRPYSGSIKPKLYSQNGIHRKDDRLGRPSAGWGIPLFSLEWI